MFLSYRSSLLFFVLVILTSFFAFLFVIQNSVYASTSDLDVLYIERTPRYNYNASKNNPAPGDTVTFTAHVKNSGLVDSEAYEYMWVIDGELVESSTAATLTSGQKITFSTTWVWQNGEHRVAFLADPDNEISEESETNNIIEDKTNALSVGLWVEQGLYDWFNLHQRDLGIESNSWEDWAQRQMSEWRSLFLQSTYPAFPNGIVENVRLDKVTVVPNGALPLSGGLATNNPSSFDRTVDLMWGFPLGDNINNGFYGNNGAPKLALDYGNFFYVETALLHELSHARYLIDTYSWNFNPHPGMDDIKVLKKDGSKLVPARTQFNGSLAFKPYECGGGQMGCYAPAGRERLYSEHDVFAWNRIAGQRASFGNQNAPGNIGSYALLVPYQNKVKIYDANNVLLPNADVYVYQSVEDPFEQLDFYDKIVDNTADIHCVTDAVGECALGPDPFGFLYSGWDVAHKGIAVIKVVKEDEEDFYWLYLSQANLAYDQNYLVGTYDIHTTIINSPEITISTPTNGQVMPKWTAFEVRATAVGIGGIAEMNMYGNGTLLKKCINVTTPCNLWWNPAGVGPHTIKVTATDKASTPHAREKIISVTRQP